MTIKLSAKQWQLYICSMKCGKAAISLNKIANDAVKQTFVFYKAGETLSAAMEHAVDLAERKFYKFNEYGAGDSEPLYVLRHAVKLELRIGEFD